MKFICEFAEDCLYPISVAKYTGPSQRSLRWKPLMDICLKLKFRSVSRCSSSVAANYGLNSHYAKILCILIADFFFNLTPYSVIRIEYVMGSSP